MRFWPGQYVQFGDASLGVPVRAYPLPTRRAPMAIRLQVTRVESREGGRTSRWLHDEIQPGDTIRFFRPVLAPSFGDPSVDTPVLCLAAGSGSWHRSCRSPKRRCVAATSSR